VSGPTGTFESAVPQRPREVATRDVEGGGHRMALAFKGRGRPAFIPGGRRRQSPGEPE